MAAVEYGTVAIVPKGEWSATTQYDVGNLVSYDGSSYVAKILPPFGTLPTDLNYWQVSAQGMGKATANTLGTVKPDGTTTEVDGEGALSVKTATQTTPGVVKGSAGVAIGSDGAADVNTEFEQATELANIIAGEAIASVLGKVSKAIATIMNINENALLKNMMTSVNINDSNKIPTAALTYAMQQDIIKNTDDISQVNSDLVAVEPKHIVRMGAFVGNITRNASMVSGKQVTLSLTILSPEAGIAGDTPIFYVNGALKGMIGFVIIGNFNTGYVFSSVNEAGDTVFHIRTSAGVNAVPGGAEIFILAVGEFV